MRIRSMTATAGLATLLLVSAIGAGCAKNDSTANRAEAAAEKAERMFSKHLHK